MTSRLATLVVACAVATVSAGCSSDDGAGATPAPTPSATTPTPSGTTSGVLLSGTGYSLTVPGSWQVSTGEVKQDFAVVDAAARDLSVTGGLPDNVNVIVFHKPRLKTAEQVERQMTRDLRQVGRRVEVQEPSELDGETAYHVTARRKVGRSRVRLSQFMAHHDRAWYIVTFSYGPQTDAETEAEEVDTMLSSFSWQD